MWILMKESNEIQSNEQQEESVLYGDKIGRLQGKEIKEDDTSVKKWDEKK